MKMFVLTAKIAAATDAMRVARAFTEADAEYGTIAMISSSKHLMCEDGTATIEARQSEEHSFAMAGTRL